jgi:uncharacterized tellurite resistance protein B-like protein
MGIIAGIVALMGAIVFALVRLNSTADAAKGLAETVGEAHGLFRGWTWRRKLAPDKIAMINDARLAAAVMVVATAEHDGALTDKEQIWIHGEFRDTLGLSTNEASELMAHARFISKDVRDLDNCFRRLAPVIKKVCGPSERADLIRMLHGVLVIDSVSNDIERQAIETLTRNLRT